MQGDPDALPDFRYHPDPVGTGSVVASAVDCACCGQRRPFTYVGPVYAAEDLDDRLCPWCIGDGRAAAMFSAEFTDGQWRAPGDVPADVADAILHRTPGFTGWQESRWMHHRGDAAEFHGRVGAPELAAFPDALAYLRSEAAEFDWPVAQVQEYLQALSLDGQPTAYLFGCRHCKAHLAYSDFP
jgi:uncharacterized protein CbrC (UPF0167 family)